MDTALKNIIHVISNVKKHKLMQIHIINHQDACVVMMVDICR